jgi:hypothetical protein
MDSSCKRDQGSWRTVAPAEEEEEDLDVHACTANTATGGELGVPNSNDTILKYGNIMFYERKQDVLLKHIFNNQTKKKKKSVGHPIFRRQSRYTLQVDGTDVT